MDDHFESVIIANDFLFLINQVKWRVFAQINVGLLQVQLESHGKSNFNNWKLQVTLGSADSLFFFQLLTRQWTNHVNYVREQIFRWFQHCCNLEYWVYLWPCTEKKQAVILIDLTNFTESTSFCTIQITSFFQKKRMWTEILWQNSSKYRLQII